MSETLRHDSKTLTLPCGATVVIEPITYYYPDPVVRLHVIEPVAMFGDQRQPGLPRVDLRRAYVTSTMEELRDIARWVLRVTDEAPRRDLTEGLSKVLPKV